MKMYHGGEAVSRGIYLDLQGWVLVNQDGEESPLPGEAAIDYLRMPGLVAALGGPFAGLVFIVVFPFVAVAGVLGFLVYRGFGGAMALSRKALQFRPAVK